MKLSNITCESEKLSRITEINLNQKKLLTPTYFPAVSSYGIKYLVFSLIRLLTNYAYPRLLFSAYDCYFLKDEEKKQLVGELGEYSRRGGLIFLDSGVYESSRKGDLKWTFKLYRTQVFKMLFDFYSSYDIIPDQNESDDFAKKAFRHIFDCYNLLKRPGFIPIFHGMNPNKLISLVKKFVAEYPHMCNFVAIPERDCGEDVVSKARTIMRIRQILNEDDHNRILHVLGCGNPISLILFSYYGADMFDSLDWIKYAINRDTLSIADFSYLEPMICDCSICSGAERNYTERVFLHNLRFYQDLMSKIRLSIRSHEILSLVRNYFSQNILNRIEGSKTG